jgi:hypothetical protein
MTTVSFIGSDQVQVFQAMALRRGLLLYADTGMKPNSAWTPAAMLRTATSITGNHYKRGEYRRAAADLEGWLHGVGQ